VSTEGSLLAFGICPIYREAGYLVASITRKSLGQFDLDKITAPERD
jgi:hypothetical protein